MEERNVTPVFPSMSNHVSTTVSNLISYSLYFNEPNRGHGPGALSKTDEERSSGVII